MFRRFYPYLYSFIIMTVSLSIGGNANAFCNEPPYGTGCVDASNDQIIQQAINNFNRHRNKSLRQSVCHEVEQIANEDRVKFVDETIKFYRTGQKSTERLYLKLAAAADFSVCWESR